MLWSSLQISGDLGWAGGHKSRSLKRIDLFFQQCLLWAKLSLPHLEEESQCLLPLQSCPVRSPSYGGGCDCAFFGCDQAISEGFPGPPLPLLPRGTECLSLLQPQLGAGSRPEGLN